jgi:hypothetical protein
MGKLATRLVASSPQDTAHSFIFAPYSRRRGKHYGAMLLTHSVTLSAVIKECYFNILFAIAQNRSQAPLLSYSTTKE